MPHFDEQARQKLRQLIDSTADANEEIDMLLSDNLKLQPSSDTLNRHEFVMLPHEVSREFIAAWLRAHDIRSFDKKTIERITAAAKTFAPGKQIDVDGMHVIKIDKHFLALTSRER
jgi:hypothetical protein